jgi:multiple sugar transport system ATP-binding protein
MADVSIRNVQKFYGALKVMDDVSIQIDDGQFVVLVGPSGCGKSTLLRMIAGLEEISAGEVVIDGRTINGLHPKDRDIAMVFQNYALYPFKTVEDNMAFALRLQGVDAGTRRAKVEEAGRILNLGNLLDRLPRALSGGQRQRVAMGRAIVRSPKVFLFDEPLSNLDAKLRVAMRAEIKALHQRLRTTTIYVTHDQIEAMTMADVIVVMNAGNVEQVGKPLELYDRPANTFVAGFIGSPSMNFLSGTLRPDGRPVFRTEDGLDLPLPAGAGSGPTAKAVYGIRPEHLRIAEDGVAMVTEVVEPTGSEVQILGRLGSQGFVSLFRERILPEPGEELRFLPDLNKVHLFDAETGQRLAA